MNDTPGAVPADGTIVDLDPTSRAGRVRLASGAFVAFHKRTRFVRDEAPGSLGFLPFPGLPVRVLALVASANGQLVASRICLACSMEELAQLRRRRPDATPSAAPKNPPEARTPVDARAREAARASMESPEQVARRCGLAAVIDFALLRQARAREAGVRAAVLTLEATRKLGLTRAAYGVVDGSAEQAAAMSEERALVHRLMWGGNTDETLASLEALYAAPGWELQLASVRYRRTYNAGSTS